MQTKVKNTGKKNCFSYFFLKILSLLNSNGKTRVNTYFEQMALQCNFLCCIL